MQANLKPIIPSSRARETTTASGQAHQRCPESRYLRKKKRKLDDARSQAQRAALAIRGAFVPRRRDRCGDAQLTLYL